MLKVQRSKGGILKKTWEKVWRKSNSHLGEQELRVKCIDLRLQKARPVNSRNTGMITSGKHPCLAEVKCSGVYIHQL